MVADISWKFVVSLSLSAIIVSLFSGGISNVATSIIIFRGAIAGFIFFLLAIAVNIIFLKLFLGVESGEGKDVSDPLDYEIGERVNIVTPDDKESTPVPSPDLVIDKVAPSESPVQSRLEPLYEEPHTMAQAIKTVIKRD